MMKFIHHDVVEGIGREAAQMVDPSNGLNGCEQDLSMQFFVATVEPAKVGFRPDTAEGAHGLGQNFFTVCDKQNALERQAVKGGQPRFT